MNVYLAGSLCTALVFAMASCKSPASRSAVEGFSPTAAPTKVNVSFHCTYSKGLLRSYTVDGTLQASGPDTRRDETRYDNVAVDYTVSAGTESVHIGTGAGALPADHSTFVIYYTGEQAFMDDRTMVVGSDPNNTSFKVHGLAFRVQEGSSSSHVLTPLLTLLEGGFAGPGINDHPLRSCTFKPMN